VTHALAARGLVKRYGERRVVDDVDLEVLRGEVVGLLGPNGAGKTTTFSMIVGGVKPDAGVVVLGDRAITAHKVRKALSICDRAYILQAGRIIREGTPNEIAADPQVRQVYLGENFQLR